MKYVFSGVGLWLATKPGLKPKKFNFRVRARLELGLKSKTGRGSGWTLRSQINTQLEGEHFLFNDALNTFYLWLNNMASDVW